jgi:predicted unusual protein kinase regulating ubiquinone biosynthesis (AarF/ABC1/UbiB family)
MNLIQLLMAVRQQDVKGMAQIMMGLSKPFREVDEQAYRRDFERRVSRYMEPGSGSGFSGAVNVAFDLLQKHGLRLDPELTLAIKALLQAEVIATNLYPETGIAAMGFDMTKDLLVESVTADKVVDVVTQQAALSLREVVQRLPTLQEATVKWLNQYERGRFEVFVDTSDLGKELKRTRSMGRQAIIAVILVGMIIGSAIAASFSAVLEGMWDILPNVALLGYAGSMVIAAVLVLGLIWRMIRGGDD